MGKLEAISQQRALGYACIYTRTVDEAAANLFRALTAEFGGVSGGAVLWLKRIEDWLNGSDPLGGLNFSGARFTDAEWRIILEDVASRLRRHITGG